LIWPVEPGRWPSLLLVRRRVFGSRVSTPIRSSCRRPRRRQIVHAVVQVTFDEAFSTGLPYENRSFDVALSTLFFHHLPDDAKAASATEIVRILRPGGRLVVGDVGRPQDPAMRLAVLATVQFLDGLATTASNVAGRLPAVLSGAGLRDVVVTDRMRTPTGTIEIITATGHRRLAESKKQHCHRPGLLVVRCESEVKAGRVPQRR
jgi:SAM-dependent methyltransferase